VREGAHSKLNSMRSSSSSSRLTNAHPSQVKEPHPTLSDGGPAEAEQESATKHSGLLAMMAASAAQGFAEE
jgi:hypothetical protein